MSESCERYCEERGWNQPRSRAYRRQQDTKAEKKLRRLADYNAPRHGYIVTKHFDCVVMDFVPTKFAYQVWMPGMMRYVKKAARRQVRRSNDVASGGAYKKVYDMDNTVW